MGLETDSGVTEYYANVYDEEQLYDLIADPNEQNNVIEDIAYEEVITEMRVLMREYIESTCPMEEGECSMPPEPEMFSSARNPYDRGDGTFSAVSYMGALDDDDDSDSDSDSDSTDSPSDSDSNSLSDSDDDDDDDDGVQLSSAKLSG